jgi:PadR family transcriptional regulator PadR
MDNLAEKCACRGSFLDKFLQPAMLIVLSRGSSHGFQMISDLEKSGMVSGDSLDPAGLYRTLKRMEASGLVSSYWDTETGSKPKRIYSITDEGRHCLGTWEETLIEYRSNIDAILSGISAENGE